MKLPLRIALRYLFSKKKHNIINIISAISISGITISTAALIIVLSVFNGFENLVISMFNAINPDFHISLKQGKTFERDSTTIELIREIDGVTHLTEVIEENVLIRYREDQHVAVIKGVSQDFREMTQIDDLVNKGKPILKEGDIYFALIGRGITYKLGINVNDLLSPLAVYVPRRGVRTITDPLNAFNTRYIQPGGVFSVDIEYDEKFFITDIQFAQKLLDYDNELTAIEIGVAEGFSEQSVRNELYEILDDRFEVKNRFQQQAFFYKVMQSEKWAIFLILSFILIIAIFNVIGTLTMLILEKKSDISVLWTLGASHVFLKKVFFLQGFLIGLLGALLGLLLGCAICWLQMKFSIVMMQSSDTFFSEAYPVILQFSDIVRVFFTVVVIALVASYIPSRRIKISRLEKKI